MQSFIIKGDICFSKNREELSVYQDGYLVCHNGVSAGVYENIPPEYSHLLLSDHSGKLIVPGLTDLHVHAPQYAFRGLGMDLELLEWLNTHTFPEESKYADLAYAEKSYQYFVEDVRRGPNTRACIFATLHTPATVMLMDMLEASGLCTMVGKVNMDRNSPDFLCEAGAETSADATVQWLEKVKHRYQHTRPILTPRFIPSCSDELMVRLKKIQQEYKLPVQSHLSENPAEVAWVKELCQQAETYGAAYDAFGLFGGQDCRTVMAHCVYSEEKEIDLMKRRNVFVAHCPDSNTNLSSGIAPIRKYLSQGIPVGLGSDVAGGSQTSVFKAMADAVQVSKLRWRLLDSSLAPLTVEEAFYLGTAGGGAFFGKVGSFAEGYEFDALIIDDSRYDQSDRLTVKQRLERTVYLSDDRDILHKYVQGRLLF